MKLSLGLTAAAIAAVPLVTGSFLRDIVAGQNARSDVEEKLLAKAVPLDEYRSHLRASGYDFMEQKTEASARDLEQNDDENDDYYMNQSYMFSLNGYSLKYATCQPVQRFSEDAISAGEYTPMVTDDIVILRLCPSRSCSGSRQFGCSSGYAEYALSASDYVRIMIRHKLDEEQQLCDYCSYCSNQRMLQDEGQDQGENNGNQENQEGENHDNEQEGNDENEQQEQNQQDEQQDQQQDQQQDEQDQENMEGDDAIDQEMVDDANGDDANQATDDNEQDGNNAYYGDMNYTCNDYKSYCYDDGMSVCNNSDDDANSYLDIEGYLDYLECTNVNGYYIRARCDGYKETISMGIFYDPFCSQYAGDKVNIRSLGLKFSSDAFREFYADSACIDCSESDYPPSFSSNSNLCNRIHISGASCTSNLQYNVFDANSTYEDTDCSYIESLRKGTYDEEGRLYNEFTLSTYREVTIGQKWGIAVSVCIVAFLAMYSCYLHHSITNLLIKSLSHTDLLPPSSRTRGGGRSRSSKRSRSGRRDSTDKITDEEWTEVNKPARQGSSRGRK